MDGESGAGHGDRDRDAALLRELAAALRGVGDLLPASARRGEASYAWRTLDADLADVGRLARDSRLLAPPVVRAPHDELRLLVFTARPLTVELELVAGSGTGQFDPPGPGLVVVETLDGPPVRVTVDDVGFFRLPPLRRGPVRLRCETALSRVVTDWVLL